ncbi:MAG: ABC transporter substrate-binding protein [Acidimicrobiales bacterium]|jgi:osmoprotectant transport system substrate-binding protein
MRRPISITLAAATLIGVAGCGSAVVKSSSPPTAPPHQAELVNDISRTVTIGSANFPENEILADIYADALAKAGARVITKLDIGSREIYFKEIQNGTLNVFPEYNGALLDYLDPSSTASSTPAVTAALAAALPPTLEALRPSAAQDADSITVTAAFAAKYHLKSIADLRPIESLVTIGADPNFATREQGLVGLKKLYGITLKLRLLDESGPLDIAALNDGSIQAADIFTTDPAISKYHYVSLADPKHLFPAENITPILNRDIATPLIVNTLDAVSAALTTDDLIQLVAGVENDHVDAATVADAFITEEHLR